jgi:NAD(P)-dependent dehydrogenase (short-subunit alcohol dehydrogenase family)
VIDFGLRDRIVVVTGGASGIGEAAVQLLVAQGCSVAFIDLDLDTVKRIEKMYVAKGERVLGIAADVRDEVALTKAADTVEKELGTVYGLLACAGIGVAQRAEALAAEEWSRVMDVNGLGMFLTCKAFAPQMRTAGSGSIVAVSSLNGLVGHAGRAAYVASKFAVNGLIKTLAIEWGADGVRVNAIAPQIVATPMVSAGIPDEFIALASDRTPMGRIAQPKEVASAMLMLLSDAASFVNGVVLPLDGGLSAGILTSEKGRAVHSKRIR